MNENVWIMRYCHSQFESIVFFKAWLCFWSNKTCPESWSQSTHQDGTSLSSFKVNYSENWITVLKGFRFYELQQIGSFSFTTQSFLAFWFLWLFIQCLDLQIIDLSFRVFQTSVYIHRYPIVKVSSCVSSHRSQKSMTWSRVFFSERSITWTTVDDSG